MEGALKSSQFDCSVADNTRGRDYARLDAVSMHSLKSVMSRSRADVESVRRINDSLRKMVTDSE